MIMLKLFFAYILGFGTCVICIVGLVLYNRLKMPYNHMYGSQINGGDGDDTIIPININIPEKRNKK